MRHFGIRRSLWGLLALVAAWGGVSTWRRLHTAAQVLATTECPFRGAPRVVVSPDVAPEDTLAVRIHEEIHAAQCRELGPVRYRLRNLLASGKLGLEAPAYCAAAAARLRGGLDTVRVRERLRDDMVAALSDVADSTAVYAALCRSCPSIAGPR